MTFAVDLALKTNYLSIGCNGRPFYVTLTTVTMGTAPIKGLQYYYCYYHTKYTMWITKTPCNLNRPRKHEQFIGASQCRP